MAPGGAGLGADERAIGAQFNYYTLGDFSNGLQVGGQVLVPVEHKTGSTPGPNGHQYTDDSWSISPGAYVGYKGILPEVPFTVSAQLGLSTIGPIINLNIGGSF